MTSWTDMYNTSHKGTFYFVCIWTCTCTHTKGR